MHFSNDIHYLITKYLQYQTVLNSIMLKKVNKISKSPTFIFSNRVGIDAIPITKIRTVFERDAHLPYSIFDNHVSPFWKCLVRTLSEPIIAESLNYFLLFGIAASVVVQFSWNWVPEARLGNPHFQWAFKVQMNEVSCDWITFITWWWVLYSCRNSLLRQKSPCFDRKSPSGNSYNWTYPLYKIFKAKIAIKWSVYKLCI